MNSAKQTIDSTDTARRAVHGTCPPACWARPATRGELRDRLAWGETCEVAEYVADTTAILLRWWLDFDAFTVRPSDNAGWTLFEPNAEHDTSSVAR
jgi:hypothetical protein